MKASELDRLVGIPYRPDFNCAHFVEHVQRELYGREVHLPGGGVRSPAERAADYGLAPTDRPTDGDLVLMFDFGKSRAEHVGLFFRLAHEGWVLHSNEKTTASALHRVRDLSAWGLRIEGYYSWAK